MRPRGGIIGATIAPSTTAASGVWHVREAEAFSRAGAWPAMPGAPTGVTGTAGASQVSLTWTAPASNGGYAITDYRVQYSSNSGSNWTSFSRSVSTATSATVTGLTNGTAYVFRVASVTFGVGGYSSNSASVTPSVAITPTAVLLTSGTSYTVPTGATSMKAWAVGSGGGKTAGGGNYGAGGVAYKTWAVSGGQSVAYTVGNYNRSGWNGEASTVTFGGTTVTGNGGTNNSAGSFSGGDGGAAGGLNTDYEDSGGAVGGNAAARTGCFRRPATDVSGLLAAVALAGGKKVEDCGSLAAFGSGAVSQKNNMKDAGLGGGGSHGYTGQPPGDGAVVLYFT